MVLLMIGFLLVAVGAALWFLAVFRAKIDDGITNNHLVTDGVYALVRNPIYSAFLSVCTGTLTAFGLIPWIALHLFYIMILYAFSWLSAGSYAEAAPPLGEALFAHFSWVPLVSEILMLPPFLYWFYLQIRQKTVFPKKMAFTNILVIYFLMYGIKSMMPDGPFRIGFTNGLMSESMIIWFGIMLAWNLCRKRDVGHENGQRERNGY